MMTKCNECSVGYERTSNGQKFCVACGRKRRLRRGRIEHREQKLRNAYGITEDAYIALFEAQKGVCAICKEASVVKGQGRLHIDHDHDTGRVRGLLCQRCNVGLGYFKDDRTRLLAAVNYLE